MPKNSVPRISFMSIMFVVEIYSDPACDYGKRKKHCPIISCKLPEILRVPYAYELHLHYLINYRIFQIVFLFESSTLIFEFIS